MQDHIELSFVVPLYNEQAVVQDLFLRLQDTMDAAEFACEVILIDDGNRDETFTAIESACQQDQRFRAILLSRNFGHQAAVSAGLQHTSGRSVGILDGDLQDPPETLLDFHKKLGEGFDVVYAIRKSRTENFVKRFCYWLFYRTLRRLASIDIALDAGDYCIMSERVVRQINAMPERHRFIRGMRSWVGFRQTGVAYDRQPRFKGRSKYTLPKLLLLATDGLLTFSETPLRIATAIGALVATGSFIWSIYIVLWRLFGDASELAGFATLACAMFLLGGIQLLCLGILGEYVARIHNEVKGRPVFIVDRLVGFGEEADDV